MYDQVYFFEVSVPNEISRLSLTEKETTFGSITKHKDIEYQAYEFSGSMRPGKISEVERMNFEGKQTLLSKIADWQDSLWAELSLKPELREVTELEQEIQNFKGRYKSISEDYFTPEEVSTLDQRLSDLEDKFKQILDSEIEDKTKLETRINELHTELQKLKGQTVILNKKHWFISFGVKVITWLSKEENRKLLKDGKLLLDEFIPEK